jgi:hypothetical protein
MEHLTVEQTVLKVTPTDVSEKGIPSSSRVEQFKHFVLFALEAASKS